MIFAWPMALWALAVVPLLIAAYALVLKRKRRAAAAAPAWATAAAPSRGATVRRHAPAVLLLLAVIGLIGAMARPNAVLTLPSRRDVVVLAIDVSGSMRAPDLNPTRLAAAQKAAREFIAGQPKTTQIGIVAFANTAVLVQRPTSNREDLTHALERLNFQEGTSVGGAIVTALQALFPKENIELADPAAAQPAKDGAPATAGPPPPPKPAAPPPEPGSETSAAIILLTDGQATAPPDPLAAAKLAADRGVRVFTVGIGTTAGEIVKENGISMRVQLDEETLKKIADITRGRYFQAGSATELQNIYRDLDARIVTETKELEISAIFVAVAAATAVLGAALSLSWFHRIV